MAFGGLEPEWQGRNCAIPFKTTRALCRTTVHVCWKFGKDRPKIGRSMAISPGALLTQYRRKRARPRYDIVHVHMTASPRIVGCL